MKTTYDERGPERVSGDPVQEVDRFVNSTINMVNAALLVHSTPSADTMELALEAKKLAVINSKPLVIADYYRGSGDAASVEMAVGASMSATKQLWDTATKIRPDDPTIFEFDGPLKANLISVLTDQVEPGDGPDANDAVSLLYNSYETAVNNLYDKVMTSSEIIEYQMKKAKREERMRVLTNFGATATAAFLGTSVALIMGRRKK